MSEATDGIERRYHPTDGTRTKFGNRLRDEGRRDAFDTRLAALKAPAKTKAARQEAWWTAVGEFAPPMQPADETETEPSPRPSPALVNAAAFANKDALPSVAAISWVASAVAIDGVTEDDAPDSASWALRCWVLSDKGNEREFWRGLFPMIVRAQRDDQPRREPPDPAAHRKVLQRILEVTDEVFDQHEAGMVRRFVEQPDVWERVRPCVENALNMKRAGDAAIEPYLRNVRPRRCSESEDEMLAEIDRWISEDRRRRSMLLREHLRPLGLPDGPLTGSAPAESLAETPQATELEAT